MSRELPEGLVVLIPIDRISGEEAAETRIADFTLGDTGVSAVVVPDKPTCGDGCAMSVVRVKADGTLERPGLTAVPRTVPGPGDEEAMVTGGGRVLAERANGNGVAVVDLATGTVSYAGGLGLAGIQERVGLLGGDAEIESVVGSGTTIFVRLPIAYPGDSDRGDAAGTVSKL